MMLEIKKENVIIKRNYNSTWNKNQIFTTLYEIATRII